MTTPIDWEHVFRLLNQGLNQRQIAERLFTSRKTVWRTIELFREIDEIYERLSRVPRHWETYVISGQIRPKQKGKTHADREINQENCS